MQSIYTTERLVLKVLDKTYANLVLDYSSRNKEFLQEWGFPVDEEFFTVEHQEKRLENDLININNGTLLRFWIFKKEDDNRVIGSVNFHNIIRGDFLSCYVGAQLDKDEINKGYITEAIRKGIDIMFNEFGLHRIEANIMPKNKRSFRVGEKLGFYNEGLASRYLRINGKWEDHIRMVLLNENL